MRRGRTEGYYNAFAEWTSSMPAGLQIIAIPCNQFGKQEPGTAAEIKAFVFGETKNPRDLQLGTGLRGKSNFTLLEKSDVNGPKAHPIFALAKVCRTVARACAFFLIPRTIAIACRRSLRVTQHGTSPT